MSIVRKRTLSQIEEPSFEQQENKDRNSTPRRISRLDSSTNKKQCTTSIRAARSPDRPSQFQVNAPKLAATVDALLVAAVVKRKRKLAKISASKQPDSVTSSPGNTMLKRFKSSLSFDSPIRPPMQPPQKEVAETPNKSENKFTLGPSFSGAPGEDPLFTSKDVRKLMLQCMREVEKQVRDEYENTLSKCLKEQFESFAQFNEDHISRQLKKDDFSYVS